MFLDLATARIFFDTVGPKLAPLGDLMQERPTLIVLHGGPGFDHSTLRPHFDSFADTHQVVYIDHRGCGRSTGAPETWTLDRWADDIAELCARLGIERPAVFGQSFGGMVAMHYAARHPEQPSRLILSSTAAHFELEATAGMMRRLGGDAAADLARAFFTDPTPEIYDAYMRTCIPLYNQGRHPDGDTYRKRAISRPEVGLHFFRHEMARMDLRPELGAISCPVLVLAGALDPVTPPVCAEDIARAIGRNARLEVFDGCGHGVHRDDPDGADRVMRRFLAAEAS